MPLINVRE